MLFIIYSLVGSVDFFTLLVIAIDSCEVVIFLLEVICRRALFNILWETIPIIYYSLRKKVPPDICVGVGRLNIVGILGKPRYS